MKGRIVCALLALAVSAGLAAPGPAAARPRPAVRHDVLQSAPVATTGGASSVGSTSAILNGLALETLPGASWGFQYGTSVRYGHLTPSLPLSTGLIAVSRRISGLRPGTVYHFRLFVAQGQTPLGLGSDLTFRTAPATGSAPPVVYGRASLPSRLAQATGGGLRIALACSGPAGAVCPGVVGVSLVRAARPSLFCAVAEVRLSASRRIQHATLSETPACAAALRAAGKHDLPGKLAAVFHGPAAPLESAVTLQPLG